MRLFFALTFSPAARAALRQAQERLRAFALGARYPGEETLHLTLAFLGEAEDPARARAALSRASFQDSGSAAATNRRI